VFGVDIREIIELTCDSCEYMIEFKKDCSKEFNSRCPYRDCVETVACMKHTKIREYIDAINTSI